MTNPMLRGDMRTRPSVKQAGFSYLVMLFAVALFGVGLGVVLPVWSQKMQEEKEALLVERANLIARALRAYSSVIVAGTQRLPRNLDQLAEDTRGGLRRHLRKVPVDPITNRSDWALVTDDLGGIVGVHSRSTQQPLRTVTPEGASAPREAMHYSQWVFYADPTAARTLTP